MLSQSNNRNHGRFIKKDDPLKKVMTISDFNLMEICDKPVTYHDNANANIIHNKLHSEEELQESVRESFEINMTFPNDSRPVIRPLDFTDEWKKQKKRLANRNQRLEEEEEFELDANSMAKDRKMDFKGARYKAIETDQAQTRSKGDSAADKDQITQPTINLFPEAKALSSIILKHRGAKENPPPKPSVEAAEPRPATKPAPTEDFIPYYSNNDKSSAETAATVQLMEPARLSQEEREKLREEARSEGYQLGYQQGEEKGTLSAQDKIQGITLELANIIENLQGMQKSILTHVQDNFLMVCQSLLEALLHKEFKINPETFAAVIERAITDTLPDDDFMIHVSPKVFRDLTNWSDPTLRKKLRLDEGLSDDHFRVEGKHAVLDGDLPKIIRDLLDQADIQLFESKEKVG